MIERLDALEAEFADVEARMADPTTIADQSRYRDLARRHKELEAIVTRARQLRGRSGDAATAREMVTELSGDDREMIREELVEAEADVARLTAELELLLLPKDPNADRNVIVEIRGAEGGEGQEAEEVEHEDPTLRRDRCWPSAASPPGPRPG